MSKVKTTAQFGSILHTMLRVGDLERSILFYTEMLGMNLFRKEEYPDGQFTLAFVGYGTEQTHSAIELTYNWNQHLYDHGSAFGHIAIGVSDIRRTFAKLEGLGVKVLRSPGPMKVSSPNRSEVEVIAFIEDPDGYRIEIIEINNQIEGNIHE